MTDTEKTCAGYLRQPHNAQPVLYLVYSDGRKEGLCRVCATRWLLSEEEWPPQKSQEAQARRQTAIPSE